MRPSVEPTAAARGRAAAAARRSPAASVLPALITALAGLALSGCAGTPREPTITGSVPSDGYRTRHPIVLAESAETIDIPVGSQSRALSAATARTLVLFAQTARERRASQLTVLVPTGSANAIAAEHAARQVAAALVEGGIPIRAISRQPYPVEDPSADAPVRVAYPRIKAMVPHACGSWPDQAMSNNQNTDYWDFGCATQANMAAMVVEPSDFVTPRGMEVADSTRRTTVVQKYRNGEATKTQATATSQNINTDVGGGN